MFQEALPDPLTLIPSNKQEAGTLVENMTETLYSACESAKEKQRTVNFTNPLNVHHRLQNILNLADSRKIWQAIDWNCRYSKCDDLSTTPSDEEFAEHFQQLLNPTNAEEVICPETDLYTSAR